jgi:hypothetical protein
MRKTVKHIQTFPGILGNKPPKFWEPKRPGGGEATSQGGQQEAAAVHYSMT